MDESLSYEPGSDFVHAPAGGAGFAVRDLDVRTITGSKLFFLDKLTIGGGERWLVRGMSGSGKSTFFRVIAALWPFGSGTVEHPSNGSTVMFLPQVPYLPNGRLAELLSYPSPGDVFSQEDYREVLADVRLERLVDDVDIACAWSKMLSPGEQQRVVLARALLQRPDFLFLDEATSSLDPDTEAAMFKAFERRLPNTTLVTIAHTDRLTRFHTHQLHIAEGKAMATGLGNRPVASAPDRHERQNYD